jgi:hypothetical protein
VFTIKTKKMKKVLFPAVLLLAGICVKAQSGIHTNFGIKAGAQAAKLGQPATNWDTKYRWHAGFLAHLHMSKHFAIQPELIYSAQGAEHITATTDTQIELGYLNLPVVFQYMTGTGFRFQAGPQVGILLNADRDVNSVETDIKNSIKKADLGLLAGFSYITKMGLGFDARYVYGLTDISKNNTAGFGSDINNLVIQVGAFYQFKHR